MKRLMGGQLHIPAVKCLRVESNFDEKNNLLGNEVDYLKYTLFFFVLFFFL